MTLLSDVHVTLPSNPHMTLTSDADVTLPSDAHAMYPHMTLLPSDAISFSQSLHSNASDRKFN